MSATPLRPSINLAPSETVEFFRAKGEYPVSRQWWEVWQEEHARAFTVAGVTDRTVLEEVRAQIDDVIANGGTFDNWKAKVLPELRDAVLRGTAPDNIISNRRLRIIYDTNLRMARAAGQWKRIQAAKAAVPYLMYRAINDSHTRAQHRIWGGLDDDTTQIILPVDHPLWNWLYPPNGWGCRCNVIALGKRDMEARGLKLTTDDELAKLGLPTALNADGNLEGVATSAFVRGDGVIEDVPSGIDPGFAYNVGKAHMRGLVPVPRDGEINETLIVGQKSPVPAPTPRIENSDRLFPENIDEARAINAWRTIVGHDDGGFVSIVDPTGSRIIVDDSFWRGTDGNIKILKRGRERLLWFIAETMRSPDEVWSSWELDDPIKRQEGTPPKKAQIVKRLLARFTLEGEAKNIIIILEVSKDGWIAKTSFGATDAAFENRRFGQLLFRRG